MQTGEDFFGLANVGLDKELGLSRLAIPPRLFRGDGPRPNDPDSALYVPPALFSPRRIR